MCASIHRVDHETVVDQQRHVVQRRVYSDGRGFTRYLLKSYKGFCPKPHAVLTQKTSRCISPGEALHVGKSSVALRRPVPEILEITNTQTDTHTDYGY